MAHWGWYWNIKKKHLAKTLCSNLLSIDSFIILKTKAKSFTVQPLNIKASITGSRLLINYGKQKNTSYAIGIDKQACNYGGFRYFFRCPLCQKRMRLLYFTQKSLFLCRKCLNLAYESQSLRPTRRYEYMNKKISDLIQKKGGNSDLCKKPPRMHTETYYKLIDKQYYYEDKSNQAFNQELHQWYDARTEPHLNHSFGHVDENKE